MVIVWVFLQHLIHMHLLSSKQYCRGLSKNIYPAENAQFHFHLSSWPKKEQAKKKYTDTAQYEYGGNDPFSHLCLWFSSFTSEFPVCSLSPKKRVQGVRVFADALILKGPHSEAWQKHNWISGFCDRRCSWVLQLLYCCFWALGDAKQIWRQLPFKSHVGWH